MEPPLAEVVDFARRAPSLHNTQPWRWRVSGDILDLYADRTRLLPVADPSGRQLVISCGVALEHARVAAAALGWSADVGAGDPDDQDHLASLTFRPARATSADAAALDLLRRRRTDRRRLTSWPLPGERLDHLARAVRSPAVTVIPVTRDIDRLRLELIARHAHHLERATPGFIEEQQGWIDRASADGMPSSALRVDDRQQVRKASRLVVPDAPAAAGEVESTDGALVLCSTGDDPGSWLSTGEVLCRLWARSVHEGLSLVPLSQPVELDRTRTALEALLGGRGRPQLVVRIAWQEIASDPLPPTPRRPLADVLAT